jgi:ABC-type sugar transport system ATPase subunit
MAEVQLREIDKRFGSRRVLDKLDLFVPEGRYLVLLGKSGCGKTTLLKIIAGLVQPDSGSVSIGGRDMTGIAPRQRDVAMVFQGDALYPHLTIAQSLKFGRQRDLPQAQLEQRVAEAIEIAGIGDILNRKPAGLSGGELRRAAVAKAIVRRSRVRLLDEPLSALDANVRQLIGKSLLQWHSSNPGTTIHVTHDGDEAMRMADLIAVIDRGRIIQSGSPREIYQTPITRTVALAIGSPPMNFIDAELVNGELQFSTAGVRPAGSWLHDCGSDKKNVSVGFRAEACQQSSGETCQQSSGTGTNGRGLLVSGTVKRNDFVGGQVLATLNLDGHSIAAALDDCSVPAGDPITLFIADEQIHLFDASGQRIDRE